MLIPLVFEGQKQLFHLIVLLMQHVRPYPDVHVFPPQDLVTQHPYLLNGETGYRHIGLFIGSVFIVAEIGLVKLGLEAHVGGLLDELFQRVSALLDVLLQFIDLCIVWFVFLLYF